MVREGRVMCRVCGVGHCVMMRATGALCCGGECDCEEWKSTSGMGGVFCVLRCDLRLFDRFDMSMCMGGKPGVDRNLFWKVVLACAMPVAMSGCLEFSASCSGVGPGGNCCRKICNRVCHLGDMGVDWGSCLVSVLVRERRCFGEFAFSCFRIYSSARCSVSGRCPRRCGFAHRISVSDSM